MLYNDPWMIESHAYALPLKEHALDHTNDATHVLKAHTTLVACYPMLQTVVSYIQPP